MTEKKFQNGMFKAVKLSSGEAGFGGAVKIPRLLPETKIRLRPNTDKRNDNSPDYWLETPDRDADGVYWAGSGAAWVKTPAAGGAEFFSLNIDMADMPAAINCAAFPADAEDQPKGWTDKEKPVVWRVTYSRPRAAKKPRADKPAPVLDDEIMY